MDADSLEVHDPLHQVDDHHPFPVALTDSLLRERLHFIERSLQKGKSKAKLTITDRDVRVEFSTEAPARFTRSELSGPAPVIVDFTAKIDEAPDGALQGALSKAFLNRLLADYPAFANVWTREMERLVDLAMAEPEFRYRNRSVLLRHCRRLIEMRIIWYSKEEFYAAHFAAHPEICPAYARAWFLDPNARVRESIAQFAQYDPLDPIDPAFSRFVLGQTTDGTELLFHLPPQN